MNENPSGLDGKQESYLEPVRKTDEGLNIQEHYEAAKQRVLSKYPEIADELKRSFLTPQLGLHHTEGPTMESHLALILQGLEKLNQGLVHENITDPKARRILIETVQEDFRTGHEFEEYAFFHDIAKPDCIRLTLIEKIPGREDEDANRIEITWEEWKKIENSGKPYRYEANGKMIEIKSIGYFHKSKGEAGNHGNVGADLLERKLGGRKPSERILTAIRMHETAFQRFQSSADADLYEAEYGSFSDEQFHFIMVASYIDFSGSLDQNGKPDFAPLLNVLASRHNSQLIKRFLSSGEKFPENKLNALKKSRAYLSIEDLEAIRMKEKVFTQGELTEKLKGLLEGSGLNSEQQLSLISDIVRDPISWGKKWKMLGKTIGGIKKVLDGCGKDPFRLQ